MIQKVSQDEAERLLRSLDLAMMDLKKIAGKAASGAERKYGIAYQNCVKAGLKPQLRKKYRGGL